MFNKAQTFSILKNTALSIKNNDNPNKNNILFKLSKVSFFKKTNFLYRNRNYNFYEVLGVERNSTNEQIKQAYIKLARQYHPDVNKDPGADDRYKNLSLAYEALSNQRNRDLYDAYMENDPYMNDWNFWQAEEHNDDGFSGRKTQRNQGGPFASGPEGDFGRSNESKTESDYDDIFNSGYKESKPQKGEDIFAEVSISLIDSYFGVCKVVKITRKEKCHSCNGMRSAKGSRPSRCFGCNSTGEIKTSKFSSKKCSQCKGTGFIIKNPCTECHAEGIKTYNVEESIIIPKGIKDQTNIRFERKGHSSENKELISGDLVIAVKVNEDRTYRREKDDLVCDLQISIVDAIFGGSVKYANFDGTVKTVEIEPGTQPNDKISFNGLGFVNTENKTKGDQVLNVTIKIPSIHDFSMDEQEEVMRILENVSY